MTDEELELLHFKWLIAERNQRIQEQKDEIRSLTMGGTNTGI